MTGRKDFVLWYLRQFGVKRLRRDYGFYISASKFRRVGRDHVKGGVQLAIVHVFAVEIHDHP